MQSDKYLHIIEVLSDIIIEDKKELKKLKRKIERIEQYIDFYTDDQISDEDYKEVI